MNRNLVKAILSGLVILMMIIIAIVIVQNYSEPSNTPIDNDEPVDTSEVKFRKSDLLTGLSNPWDIDFLPNNAFIISEKRGILSIFDNAKKFEIDYASDVYQFGEGGMLGIAVDPKFEENRFIYVCFNSDQDVRVRRIELTEAFGIVEARDILSQIPSNISGRHSGCQLEFGPDDHLWIGTGDAADEDNPQNPNSLGGKILRVDRDGNGVTGNMGHGYDNRIYSLGHRNVQGITFFRDSTLGSIGVSSEHGPRVDDEINLLLPGNFGWDPGQNYNESVPMTDTDKFPDAHTPIWKSGDSTIAISGITMIYGEQWGKWNNAVAVAALAGNQVKIFKINEETKILEEIETILTDVGRVRTIKQAPDGSLYVLTDNGNKSDKIIRLIPVD